MPICMLRMTMSLRNRIIIIIKKLFGSTVGSQEADPMAQVAVITD